MWLYRVFAMDPASGEGIFYDATASEADAVRFALNVQKREPRLPVTVEAEHWPLLSWFAYQKHMILGTHEGFGVDFKEKHKLEISERKTAWPK